MGKLSDERTLIQSGRGSENTDLFTYGEITTLYEMLKSKNKDDVELAVGIIISRIPCYENVTFDQCDMFVKFIRDIIITFKGGSSKIRILKELFIYNPDLWKHVYTEESYKWKITD